MEVEEGLIRNPQLRHDMPRRALDLLIAAAWRTCIVQASGAFSWLTPFCSWRRCWPSQDGDDESPEVRQPETRAGVASGLVWNPTAVCKRRVDGVT